MCLYMRMCVCICTCPVSTRPVSTRPVSSCLVSSCLDLFVCVYPCLFVCLLVCFLAFRFWVFFWFGWLVVAVAVDVCALVVFVWWLWVVVGSVSLFGCVVGMFVWVCLGLCACVLGGGERVYASNAPPCVRSKRFRVYWQHAHMFHTCGLGAGTHADVLNVHTETRFERAHGFFFPRSSSVPQHTNTNTHTHTKHTPRPPMTPRVNDTTTTQHNTETETERERE